MRAIDAATTTNSSTNPAANPNTAPAANEPRIAPQNTTGRHHSPSDARRLRFAAAWHRRSIAGATADPSLRPAYAAPIAAPEAPPADALVVTPQSLDVADDGERLIAIAPDGRRLHFFHDGLFRVVDAHGHRDRRRRRCRARPVAAPPVGPPPRQRDVVDRCGRVPLHRLIARDAGARPHRAAIRQQSLTGAMVSTC